MGDTPTSGTSGRVVVEFCYDFASPFSYLADCQIDQALADTSVELRRVPVYLRGFETFRQAPAMAPAKLAYLARDMIRTAEYRGIPMAPPKHFPINGLYLLRGAIYLAGQPALSRFVVAGFRAAWVDQREVSSAEAAADIAAEVGVDRDAFLAGIGEPSVKEALKRNTDDCVARGGFGVPTFFVGKELFWGQDRIDQVLHFAGALAEAATADGA